MPAPCLVNERLNRESVIVTARKIPYQPMGLIYSPTGDRAFIIRTQEHFITGLRHQGNEFGAKFRTSQPLYQ